MLQALRLGGSVRASRNANLSSQGPAPIQASAVVSRGVSNFPFVSDAGPGGKGARVWETLVEGSKLYLTC
jgi:hypothetical protein